MDSNMTSAVLDNGLKVLVEEVHTAPLASVWCWYKVGSKDEVTGLTGVSHWVEHMNFKGTTNIPRDQVKGIIEKFGGSWNGYTWIDQTTYMETASTAGLDRMLFIEAERMANCLYDPEDCESERTVIISELQGSENDPDTLLEQEVIAAAYKVHPYRHPTIGWLSDLQTMTRDDLYQYYRRNYVPNNATVVVVGDVDTDDVLRRVEKQFGAIPAGPAPRRVRVVEPEQLGERRIEVSREGTTAYLKLAYHAPAVGDPDFFPMLVLDAILTGAKGINLWSSFRTPPPQRSARLYRALVERRLASSVGAGLLPTEHPFLYLISATAMEGVSLQDVEGAATAALDERRAERHHRARAGQSEEPASGATGLRERQRHESRPSARIFSDSRQPRRVSGRAEPHCRSDAGAGRERREEIFANRSADGRLVQANRWSARHDDRRSEGACGRPPRARQRRGHHLEGGAYRPGRHDSGRRESREHLRLERARRPQPSCVARARPRHRRRRTSDEIAEAFDERGVSLTVGANRHVMTVSCTCLSEDFEAMLELVGEIVMQPAFPDQEIEKRKGEVLNAIRQDEDNPAAMAMQALFAMLYPDQHPYGRPSKGTVDSVSRIERARSDRRFTRRALRRRRRRRSS